MNPLQKNSWLVFALLLAGGAGAQAPPSAAGSADSGAASAGPAVTAPAVKTEIVVNPEEKAGPALAESAVNKVPVELEWEEIPGAKDYELEFQDLNGRVLKTFKSPSNVFKFKFKVGKYFVRSRVADARKVFGDWSAATDFMVKPKPVVLPEKSVVTKGVINPKTLTSEVTYHWGQAPGASQFRLRVINEKDEVIKEALVKGFYYKTQLAAGVYTTTLTSISEDGIESDPVTLPGRVVIETVQLPKPEILFEEVADSADPKIKIKRLPQVGGVPVLRWKENSLSDTVGTLEYRYFFGDEWIPVDHFASKTAKEIILEKSRKPGKYRITVWAESKGLKKSESVSYEFVIKPTEY
jgi:hypothetical protein